LVVDATLGWGGHAAEFLKPIRPDGKLIGLDLDLENLAKARTRLEDLGGNLSLQHLNFAGVAQALNAAGETQADALIADLGFSSMQVDDAARGLSYRRDGPLDMRLDRSRGKTAAQMLAAIAEDEL